MRKIALIPNSQPGLQSSGRAGNNNGFRLRADCHYFYAHNWQEPGRAGFNHAMSKTPIRSGALRLLVALFCSLGWGSHALAQSSREYELKAVFLCRFAQFTQWPANAFDKPQAPLVIGVLGTNPFGRSLDEAVSGENAQGHPLAVKRCRTITEAKSCQILFIANSESRRLENIAKDLDARPVLTVSDIDAADARGVMIRLITENNRIHMRVNLDQVSHASLSLSSKLLRLGEIVTTEKK